MSELDRRQLLTRAGGAALAGAALPLIAASAAEGRTPNISALQRAVKGPVFTRSSRGFNAERTVFNAQYANVVPLVVVRAASAADVAATVKWAAHYGVPITARSGGHSYGGYSTIRNGVVVDLRSLHSIRLGTGTATIGAGNNLWTVYSTLARHGVTIPGGSCPTVGFAGLALGGGMGLAARRYGMTTDSIKSVQIVTADGRIRTASPSSNADLYWACRGGGGGNFGIVTSFTMQTHPAPNCAYFFASWPWSEAEAVLGAWQRFAPVSPSALTSICSLLGNGGATPRVTALGQYFGTEAQLRSTLAPFLRDAPGATISYGTSNYMGLVSRWAGCVGESSAQCSAYRPQAFAAKSSYVSKVFSTAGLRAAVSAVERGPGAGSLLFDCYGGAINEVPASKTAFVHRGELACIQYYYNGGGSSANSWLKSAASGLKPYVSTAAYQNYIDPTLNGYMTAYYGSNLPRLRSIKKTYDPHTLFSFAKGITPPA